MIILKLKAGLGNQLFEYACARAKALREHTQLYIDTSWYKNIHAKDTVRTYGLGVYQIIAEEAPATLFPIRFNRYYLLYRKIWSKIQRDIFGRNDYTFDAQVTKLAPANKTILLEGYFNSEKYFKDSEATIRNELTLKNQLGETAAKTEQKINQYIEDKKILVLIHLRRGDYVTNTHARSFHGTQTAPYYTSALKKMTELLGASVLPKVHYILVSDDTDALQTDIVPLLGDAPYTILSNPDIKDYEEIYLMSLCHHFIIANSSFSWWGTWLSKTAENLGGAKIVIGPKHWVANPKVKTPDVMPEEWIRV